MIERILYGPMEYLTPDTDLTATLEIGGIRMPQSAFTTFVFLDEVESADIDDLVKTPPYAGFFKVPDDAVFTEEQLGTVRLDITEALRNAEERRPNFHITFLTQYTKTATDDRIFKFESVHILHEVPIHTDIAISANVMGGLPTQHKDSI